MLGLRVERSVLNNSNNWRVGMWGPCMQIWIRYARQSIGAHVIASMENQINKTIRN